MSILAVLRTSGALRRLLAVRLTSQITDGAFQAALAFSILFNPERHADPLQVAAGFAVLLLPYSVLGPFTGALLDHWDRRQVLVWVNTLRALAIGLVAIAMATSSPDAVVLMLALIVTGCSRFVASGLSASLPRVAPPELLVPMNSLFTTLGAAMLAVGAGLSAALRSLTGADDTGSGATLLAGALIALASGLIAARFARKVLGPDEPDDAGHSALHAVARGLGHGITEVARHRTVAAALGAIGVHRIAFGMNTLMILLLVRHTGLGSAMGEGVRGLATVGVMVAIGALVAAVTVPWTVSRFDRSATIASALVIGALAELSLIHLTAPVMCASAAVLGWAGQTVKLCGDVAMQSDIPDHRRGQVFAVQDAVFNIAYVAAITVTALVVPDDGVSAALVVTGTVIYLIGGVVVACTHPRTTIDQAVTEPTSATSTH